MELFSFDEHYIQKLRERDLRTEQHFAAYFSRLLVIKLRSRLRTSSAVDDICQETFVRVFKALHTEGGIRNPERLGAFVNSVCNNILQEFYRSSGHAEPLAEDADPPDRTIDLDGMLVSKQTRALVRQVLAQLPQKDARLLHALLEEKDKDEICREFGVDRDYLRVLIHRAKESFRVIYLKSNQKSQIGTRTRLPDLHPPGRNNGETA